MTLNYLFNCDLNCDLLVTNKHLEKKKSKKIYFLHLLHISIVVVKKLRLLDNYWNVPRYNEGWEISCCFGWIP